MPQRGVGVHERLGVLVRATGTAFEQVAGNGERSAGEANQGNGKLAGQDSAGFEYVRCVGLGFERTQSFEVGGRSEWVGDNWANARGDIDTEADGSDRYNNVAVQDGGVDTVATDWLQGDFGGQFGLGNGVKDGAWSAYGTVFGQGSTRLAHVPDWGVGHGLSPTGPQKDVVHDLAGYCLEGVCSHSLHLVRFGPIELDPP